MNGLVDASGDESESWQGHVLTVEAEKVVASGKRVTAVYLVPEGYERIEDENGYVAIVKKGTKVARLRICLCLTSSVSESGASPPSRGSCS